MKLSVLVPSSFVSMSPLHTWSGPIKRTVLALAVVMVFVTYMLLASGIIALVVVLTQSMR